MSRAIDWTDAMDAALRALREQGRTCHDIGAALGLSKNAVINRCDRLGLVTGYRFRARNRNMQPHPARRATPSTSSPMGQAPAPISTLALDRDWQTLPAGHPASWGLISRSAWPGVQTLSQPD